MKSPPLQPNRHAFVFRKHLTSLTCLNESAFERLSSNFPTSQMYSISFSDPPTQPSLLPSIPSIINFDYFPALHISHISLPEKKAHHSLLLNKIVFFPV